jgi:peroxiredoxin family protein
MKKVFFAALAGVLFMACNNTAKFEAPINALSDQWNAATTSVADFAVLLNQEISNAQMMSAAVAPPVDKKGKVEEAKKAQLDQIAAAMGVENQALAALNQEVSAFVTSWGEKAKKLEDLKAGLANRKLGKDTDAIISELQTAAGEAGTQVASWTEKMNAAKAKIMDLAKQQGQILGASSSSLTGK